jgi:hypothetical protein
MHSSILYITNPLLNTILDHSYQFGPTLMCYLSRTEQTEVGLLNKCLAAALGVAKFITISAMNLLTVCCAA